jgi:HAD superfamily hydrolase (TIGR01509 family)
MIRALLWDVDGTLAETERFGHLVAFNQAFAAAGVPWRWNEARYGELLAVAGGRERLLHDLAVQPAAPQNAHECQALAARLHQLKNERYAAIVRAGGLPLRAGVTELLSECAAAGVALGIVTTTGRANVAGLLMGHLGRRWAERFAVVVCAEDAPRKKPDPQAYLSALGILGIAAHTAVAMEDSPAGMEAARRAGVPVIVTFSHYFPAGAAPPAAALASGASLASGAEWWPRPESPAQRITLKQIERWRDAGGGSTGARRC